MGYTERYEDRQKKQRKKEKKEQLDFFLLEKGRVLLKWRLSVGCDVYQMGWSKWGNSGFDKDREIEWRFVWLRTISFYHPFPFLLCECMSEPQLWDCMSFITLPESSLLHLKATIPSFTSQFVLRVTSTAITQLTGTVIDIPCQCSGFHAPNCYSVLENADMRGQIPFCFWSLNENIRMYLYSGANGEVSLK